MHRRIRRDRQFDKDFQKLGLKPGKVGTLKEALALLQAGNKLPPERRDHPLTAGWRGYREFHLGGDLLVIYRMSEDELVLARIGSHADLFD